MRPPYTEDFVCTVHGRTGDDPEEHACGAFLFTPVSAAAKEPAKPPTPSGNTRTTTAPVAPKKYRRRPEPPEVTAVAFGAGIFMVSTGTGPEFPMQRDQFLALYEEVEAEELPEKDGALGMLPESEQSLHLSAEERPGDELPATRDEGHQ